ncbi:MAG: sigma-54-dependent transcriptional regulator [Candidatus Eisenbacteria bacterium]|nr:sigma-54 dependent transcriptional regulator [Candidatus Eisenbacteria bacterium]
MPKETRILVVDDEEPIRKGLARIISGMGHTVDLAEGAEEALQKALTSPPDLVITDLQLPGRSGLDLISDLSDRGIEATLVVLTAHGTIDSAVEATRRGVYDYLVKPVDPERLATVIFKGLERASMRQEVLDLRREMVRSGRFQSLIGKSPPMLELYRMIDQIAPSSASVLITGESGTGKEVVARAIHNLSPRSAARFVAINCAAIPETLLESEIFGHEKGAFTGATASRPGTFELADKGTLFLDEIGEMPAALQSKLLRVLEERKVRRVGGQRETPVDVRVLAATNMDVEQRMGAGHFREDLYFRLNVFTLHIPPLRERPEDIPLLAQSFLEEYAQENQKPVVGFAEETLQLLMQYDWPGNVRELRNAIQRAVILSKEEEIQPSQLPPAVRPSVRKNPTKAGSLSVSVGTPLSEVEKAVILETLEACGGNKTRASGLLGISTKTLHMKLRSYRAGAETRAQAGS